MTIKHARNYAGAHKIIREENAKGNRAKIRVIRPDGYYIVAINEPNPYGGMFQD